MDGLHLVQFDKCYFDLSKSWLTDSELRHLIHAETLPSDEERLRWFELLSSRSDYRIWGIDYLMQPIGVCGLKHITDGQAEYWGYIGEKSFWGKGLGSCIMTEVLLKAQDLRLTRVYLRVRKYNLRAFRMYEKYGFSIDSEDSSVYCMSMII